MLTKNSRQLIPIINKALVFGIPWLYLHAQFLNYFPQINAVQWFWIILNSFNKKVYTTKRVRLNKTYQNSFRNERIFFDGEEREVDL